MGRFEGRRQGRAAVCRFLLRVKNENMGESPSLESVCVLEETTTPQARRPSAGRCEAGEYPAWCRELTACLIRSLRERKPSSSDLCARFFLFSWTWLLDSISTCPLDSCSKPSYTSTEVHYDS